MLKSFAVIGVLWASTLFAAATPAPQCLPGDRAGTDFVLTDVLMNEGRFSKFFDVVRQTGLSVMLSENGPFTVFAPTNEAIDRLPAGQWIAVLEGPRLMKAVIMNHVVNGELRFEDLRKRTDVETLFGSHFALRFADDGATIADAQISSEVLTAKNGLVYVIDKVLPTPYIE